jgi:hypothetical protein
MQNAFGGFIWDFEKQSTVLFSETCFAVWVWLTPTAEQK